LEKQERAYGPEATAAKQAPAGGAQEKPPASAASQAVKTQPTVKKKLWYCKQCGYVVFREDPPYVCPVCKAKRDMFAEIESSVEFNG
jgi:rubrerythrin